MTARLLIRSARHSCTHILDDTVSDAATSSAAVVIVVIVVVVVVEVEVVSSSTEAPGLRGWPAHARKTQLNPHLKAICHADALYSRNMSRSCACTGDTRPESLVVGVVLPAGRR